MVFRVQGASGVFEPWVFDAATLTQRDGRRGAAMIQLDAKSEGATRLSLKGALGSGTARLEAEGLAAVEVEVSAEGDFVATTMVAGQTETVAVEGHLGLCRPPR